MIPTWMTSDGERVTVGDHVLISSLLHPDAIGEIVRSLPGDRIECHVTEARSRPADFHLAVWESQLICRFPLEESSDAA